MDTYHRNDPSTSYHCLYSLLTDAKEHRKSAFAFFARGSRAMPGVISGTPGRVSSEGVALAPSIPWYDVTSACGYVL